MMVQGILSKDAFVMVNKRLARFAGFVEAGILGEMIATHGMCENKIPMSNGKHYDFFKGGQDGEWFYLTQPAIEANLGIKRRQHDKAIENLIELNLIQKEQKGLPAKSHYLINFDLIFDIMADDNFASKKQKKAKKEPETLIQSGCTKRTTKEVQNVQPREYETYNQGSTKRTTIKKINKKDLKKEFNKNQSIRNEKIDSLLAKHFKNDLPIDWIDGFHKVFDLYSDKLHAAAYQRIMNRVKKYIHQVDDIEGYLISCVENELNPKQPVAKGEDTKAIRTEMTPDWLHKETAATKEEPKTPAISEERKKAIWEQVKKMNGSKNA